MFETVAAILLFILSFTPNFSSKAQLEGKLKSKILMVQTEQKNNQLRAAAVKSIPEKVSPEEISLGATAALFIDRSSGEILYEKNKSQKLSMASTTKLMTALVAVETLNLNETITVPELATRPFDSVVGLSTGDKVKTIDLLHGLLIQSGADAAITLEKRIAGGTNQFAAMMNERATLMGLTDTQFTNSVGYDDQAHYSSTTDLVKLAKISLANKTIAEIVGNKTYHFTTENGREYWLTNTNKLLNDNFKGIKTGTTFGAGECLVVLYQDGQREIIGVVLNSPDRFGETKSIIEWTKRAFSW